MAEFLALMQQHRHQFIVKRFKCRVGIDVQHFDVDTELAC